MNKILFILFCFFSVLAHSQNPDTVDFENIAIRIFEDSIVDNISVGVNKACIKTLDASENTSYSSIWILYHYLNKKDSTIKTKFDSINKQKHLTSWKEPEIETRVIPLKFYPNKTCEMADKSVPLQFKRLYFRTEFNGKYYVVIEGGWGYCSWGYQYIFEFDLNGKFLDGYLFHECL